MKRYLVSETRTDVPNPRTPGQPVRVVHGYRTLDVALVLMGAAVKGMGDAGLDLVPSDAAGLAFDVWKNGRLVGSLQMESQDLTLVGGGEAALCGACGQVHEGRCLESEG